MVNLKKIVRWKSKNNFFLKEEVGKFEWDCATSKHSIFFSFVFFIIFFWINKKSAYKKFCGTFIMFPKNFVKIIIFFLQKMKKNKG